MLKLAAFIVPAVLLSGVANSAPGPAVSKITAFYASCLSSGGVPGIFDVAGSDTQMILTTAQPVTLSLTISPDAGSGFFVAVMRKNGGASGTANLYPGQSLVATATEISAKHNFKGGEYCLRAL